MTSHRVESLLLAGRTPGDVAGELSLDLGEYAGESVVLLLGWIADDGNAEVEYPEAASAREAAERYVAEGDWGDDGESVAVRVLTWRVGLVVRDGEIQQVRCDEESHLFIKHPEPPTCAASVSGEHRWVAPHALVGGIEDNPGVWGTVGAGIRTVEVCAYCGMAKIEQSASQPVETEYDHDTVRYESGYVPLDELADYHGGELPEGLDPDSDLAREIRGRRLRSSALRAELEELCEVREPGADALGPYGLVLVGLSDEDVVRVAELLGDGYQIEEYRVEEEGWARGPASWHLGSVVEDLDGEIVHVVEVRS